MAVRVKAYEGLQKRSGELICERDEPYLREIEMKGVLKQGIDSGQEGGHHVVQEMANADDRQNLEDSLRSTLERGFRRCQSIAHSVFVPANVRKQMVATEIVSRFKLVRPAAFAGLDDRSDGSYLIGKAWISR